MLMLLIFPPPPVYLELIIFKCWLNDIKLIAADVNRKSEPFSPNRRLNKQPTFEYSLGRRSTASINSRSLCQGNMV